MSMSNDRCAGAPGRVPETEPGIRSGNTEVRSASYRANPADGSPWDASAAMRAGLTEVAENYEGGFNLTSKYDGSIQGHVSALSRYGEIDLVVQASAGRASASAAAGLSVEQSRELRLMLEQAERAAESYAENYERTT